MDTFSCKLHAPYVACILDRAMDISGEKHVLAWHA